MNNDFNNNNNNNNSVNSPFVPDDLLILVKKDNNKKDYNSINNQNINTNTSNSTFIKDLSIDNNQSNGEIHKPNLFFDNEKPKENIIKNETSFDGKFFGLSNNNSNNDDKSINSGSDKLDFLIGKPKDNVNKTSSNNYNFVNNPVSIVENNINENNNIQTIPDSDVTNSNNQPKINDFLTLVNHKDDKKVDVNFNQDNNMDKIEDDINSLPQANNFEQKDEKQVDVSDFLMKNVYNANVDREIRTKNENKVFLTMSITLGSVFVVILLLIVLSTKGVFNFAAGEAYYENKDVEYSGQYQTAVYTDNMYKNVSIKDANDAKELIKMDSNNQKDKCDNEKTKLIEKDIEEKYGIVATNFCEMDEKLAKEIEKVIGTIYKEFPSIEGYLTNLTIVNAPEDINYIASFVSAKLFAKSNTRNSFPNVYKMSIMLNAQYFLNTPLFKEVVKSQTNYFPKNATIYSLVAHEFGHYLSFLAQLNNTKGVGSTLLINSKNYNAYYNLVKDSNDAVFSKKMIEEAYNNYKKKSNKFRSEYEFRNSISEYSVAVDNLGNDLYDETIAEAFHDYYVNRKNAKPASLEIVEVLKKYLNN